MSSYTIIDENQNSNTYNFVEDSTNIINISDKITGYTAENFADGKKPGRKGLSKRVGVSQKMSVAQLAKIAKTVSGERKRMPQWNHNMKRGRKKS